MDIFSWKVAGLIRKTAREITEPFRRDIANRMIDFKSDGSLVTAADRRAEAFLTHHLKLLLPGSLVLGEETCPRRNGWDSPLIKHRGPVWVIDPIDGTSCFTEGGAYGIMVALRKECRTIGSWIYFPETKDLLCVPVNGKHTLHIEKFGEGRRIARHVTIPRKPLGEMGLAHYPRKNNIPQSYGLNQLFAATPILRCIATTLREMVLKGACAVVTQNIKTPWDYCATTHILERAGGLKACEINGRAFRDGSQNCVMAPYRYARNAILASAEAQLALQ